MKTDETLLRQDLVHQIVRRVLSVTRPERIIVFGSAATSQMAVDSDIDLLVVVPSPPNPFQDTVRIGNALRGLGYPFDVIVMGSERFEETKHVFGGIAYPASRYGKTIYEAA